MQLRSQSCDSVNESPFCRGFRSQSRDFSVLATHADTACVHALLKSLSGLHAQALRKALLGCQAVAAFHVSLNPKPLGLIFPNRGCRNSRCTCSWKRAEKQIKAKPHTGISGFQLRLKSLRSRCLGLRAAEGLGLRV